MGVFHGYFQAPMENPTKYFKLGHDQFLPDPIPSTYPIIWLY
jgi:hypothetical protein